MFLLYVFIGVFVNLARADDSTLSFISPCTPSSKECVLASAQKAVSQFVQKGVPEYNVDPMEPLNIGNVKFDLAGLKFSLQNGVIKGLKSTVLDDVIMDVDKGLLELELHCNITLRGQYKASGRLLILPIQGDGDMKLKAQDLSVKIKAPFEIHGEGKNRHINLLKYTYTYDIRERATYTLTNLFGGHKVLSDNLHAFLNENWKQISKEFGTPVLETAINKIYERIKQFFAMAPYDELVML